MVERREKKKSRKKIRWKRMYVGHVAAGIASMCHRGNHAGNAEAHLTALPSCIQLPPSYSVYIYCLRASTNRLSFTALSFLLAITFPTSLFLSARFYKKIREIRRILLVASLVNGQCLQSYFDVLLALLYSRFSTNKLCFRKKLQVLKYVTLYTTC